MRRTPALTAKVRERWVEEMESGRFTWYSTIKEIAEEVGLTPEQVRDAIWSPSADKWRAAYFASLHEEKN